ncbi:MAG TPA: TadE/TadG family type IV pilus assembly protein [Chloroflexota bacterium]
MRKAPAQALVEFALAIGVFMLLVLGTFDLARAHLSYTVLTNSAREASRYAAAHVGEPNWQAASVQAGRNLAVGIDTSRLTLTVAASTGSPGYVTVDGAYNFQSVTPFVGALLGNPINMQVHTSALAG